MTLSRELQLGKAAEHLVCGDLILQGFNAFLADQGLPYDIIVDTEEGFKTIQVKSTLRKSKFDLIDRGLIYRFNTKRAKHGSRRLDHTRIDYIAFMALDNKKIAYIPISYLLNKSSEVIVGIEFKDRNEVYELYPGKPRQFRYSKYIDDHSVFPEHSTLTRPKLETILEQGESI